MTFIKKLVIYGFKSFPRKTELPFTPNINVILGPNGSGKSSSYDTLVTLSNGAELELGKLVEDQIKKSKEIKKLDDGIYVDGIKNMEIISLNKYTGKQEIKKISKFIKRDGEILYKIKTKLGKEVKATGCHPVMTFKDGEIKSVLIRDLKDNSLIATPREINVQPDKQYPEELARLIGYLIGDGYLAHDRIEFINKDPEVIEDFKKIINSFFKVDIKERKDKNVTRLYIRNKKFVKQIRNIFIKDYNKSITSNIKKIPKILLRTNKKVISELLAGLYDTDGSVRKDIAVIEFCTKNKELANQMQGLLLRFGIISKIKKRICYASNTINKIKRSYYYLYIYGKDNLQKFHENISLKIEYKRKIIKSYLSKNIISNPNNDILPKEINLLVKKLIILLGIKAKPLRKEYPFLMAYLENRCFSTRIGISKLLPLFNNKLLILKESFNNLSLDQTKLITCMDQLNIPGQVVSQQIGMHKQIIKRDWATNRFNARPQNLTKFYNLIKMDFENRFMKIEKILSTLNTLANSDIYWDQISSIEKVKGEKYVYDLTIDQNHNFIANNIFVHNSNISDALCFVLGRLSTKSMRAKKTGNLIFLGSKSVAPSKEAFVEIIFDNSENVFSIEENEVSVKRIVRKNGQSIYKINNKTRTRQEVLFLLAQAGIDPNGFNIILQWEIQNFVRMPPIDRRKIIEEVSGISIYESRKEKSLKELGKTEDRLNEVYTILRERTSYLKNLERERQQALRFKKLESDVKKYQASIIYSDLTKKKKEAENISLEISKKNKEIDSIKEIIMKNMEDIENFQLKISSINSTIKKSTGFEQEKINQEIADLRAELAGLSVKTENYEGKVSEISKQKLEFQRLINENENSIKELQKEPLSKKQEEIDLRKQELEKLEEQRKKFYMAKSELKSIKDKIEDKKNLLKNYLNDSDFLLEQIEQISDELFDKKTNEKNLDSLKISLEEKNKILIDLEDGRQNLEKIFHTNKYGIKKQEELAEKISKIEICPVCKSKVTKDHIHNINDGTVKEINFLKKEIGDSEEKINAIKDKKEVLNKEVEKINSEILKRESDLIKILNINNKNEQIKILQEKIDQLKEEIIGFEKTKNNLEKNFNKNSNIEQKYEIVKIEVEEISLRSKENVDSEISFKQRELDRAKISLKQFLREEEDLNEELLFNKNNFDEKQEILEDKKNQEEELSKKFKKLISERDEFYKKVREEESRNLEKQNSTKNIEYEVNSFNIEIARFNAEIENLEKDMLEFKDVLIIKTNRESLIEKLNKTKEMLSKTGYVNLLSLKVYDSVKEQYDEIKEKAEIIEKEKQGIFKVIHEIDVKKKKTFLKTLDILNETFSRNFSSLSQKGKASLELENRKNPFEGGVDILIKAGHGKYLDVASLSGGERVLVALSLIFAIQELNPYCFYILDEVDASLDKRNSERLANLFKKYVQKGQYIIITHNDDIISNATNLYGVSMHEGISKIVSLKI